MKKPFLPYRHSSIVRLVEDLFGGVETETGRYLMAMQAVYLRQGFRRSPHRHRKASRA